MSNGEWTVLGIFIGLLFGMGVYNTLELTESRELSRCRKLRNGLGQNRIIHTHGHSGVRIAERCDFAESIFTSARMMRRGRVR